MLTRVESRAGGLSNAEAGERTADRTTEVTESEAAGLLRATLEELANPLTPALATGAGLSAGLGSITDAGLISGVMGLNAVVGGLQRVGADRAVRRLMETGAAHVHVRRSGVEVMLEADSLVVGDVVVLRAGDAVPADCRILDAEGVEVDESSLTGESQTVTKTSQPSAARALADRHSMLYAGTAVAAGEATGVVVAVGEATEVGRSARAGTGKLRRSGVERRLSHLTAQTVPAALGAGAGLMGAALLHGRPFSSTLGTGVGLAVAAVPEGLPLVATVAQLASARRLSGRSALVRQPSTIEALGRVDVLCADKTGTLTTGRISLQLVSDGTRAEEAGHLGDSGRRILAAALRATPRATSAGHVAHATDGAVLEGARSETVSRRLGAAGWRMETQLPFEPGRGYHAVLGRVADQRRLSVKGSPEVVLPRCLRRARNGTSVPFSTEDRRTVHAEADRLARQGYRVLAVAERRASSAGDLDDRRIDRLELRGLLALADPVRPSAAEAVAGLRAAGVDVVMITGDHPSTAESIAAELALLDNGGEILTGPELDPMHDRGAEQPDRPGERSSPA